MIKEIITFFFKYGVGIVVTIIPIVDVFGERSMWCINEWNVGRIGLNLCCLVSGFLTCFHSDKTLNTYDNTRKD